MSASGTTLRCFGRWRARVGPSQAFASGRNDAAKPDVLGVGVQGWVPPHRLAQDTAMVAQGVSGHVGHRRGFAPGR